MFYTYYKLQFVTLILKLSNNDRFHACFTF